MARGAIVLAGGRSSRMGRPKADLPLGGEPFLSRVVAALVPVVGATHIVAVRAADQLLPPLPAGVMVAVDAAPGRGPLEGFAAGLLALPADCDALFLAACDAPLLRPEVVRLLFARLDAGATAAVPEALGRRHPLCAAYRASVRAAVAEALAAGELGMGQMLARVAVTYVGEEELRAADPDLASLRNVNTPEDYAELDGGVGDG